MKRFLSVIFLTILLTSAICSCRSSKQSSAEYSDTTSVSAAESVSTLSKDEILSLISASRELDLSGIKIEFFRPDSIYPDSRAAPKSLTIESAKAKESTEQATHETAAVDEQKTVNLSARSSASGQQDMKRDKDIMRPPDWVIGLTGLLLLISFSVFVILYTRRALK